MRWLTLEPWTFGIGVFLMAVAVFGYQALTISTGPSSEYFVSAPVAVAGICFLIVSLILGKAHLDSQSDQSAPSSP